MTAMLKHTPERALKSHESFQVSFSSAGKMGIVESDASWAGAARRNLAAATARFARYAPCSACRNKRSMFAEGFRGRRRPG